MGISGYFSLLMSAHPNIGKVIRLHDPRVGQPKNRKKYDRLYVDVNNILYTLAKKSNDENHLLSLLFTTFSEILNTFEFTKSVFFALDGVGPKAKLLLQRDRRATPNAKWTSNIDPLQFTPGTKLMNTLKEGMCYFSAKRMSYSHEYQSISYYVSGADREGEGEYKIFEHIDRAADPTEKILVFGADTDLILFALESKVRDINILKSLGDGRYYDLSMLTLRESLVAGIKGSPNEQEILRDFIFLSVFCGNDYLPKLRNFQFWPTWLDYQGLRNSTFVNTPLYIANRNAVNWELLEVLFQPCVASAFESQKKGEFPAWNEEAGITHPRGILTHIFHKYFGGTLLNYALVDDQGQIIPPGVQVAPDPNKPPIMRCLAGDVVLGEGTGPSLRAAIANASINVLNSTNLLKYAEERLTRKQFIDFAAKFDKTPITNAQNQALKFMEGILWTCMYFRTQCVNLHFHYPYLYAPSVGDLLAIKDKDIEVEHSAEPNLSLAEFCLSLMPVEGKRFLPLAYQRLLEPKSEIYDLYRTADDLPAKWDGNLLDQKLQRIREAVSKTPIMQQELSWNKSAPTLQFSLTTTPSPVFRFQPPEYPLRSDFRLRYKPHPQLQCLSEQAKTCTFALDKSPYMKEVNPNLKMPWIRPAL